MDYKKRITDAIARYEERQGVQIKPQRKNQKPEKLVEDEVSLWLRQNQFDCDIVEAKAKFSTATGRYSGRAASPGMSDIVGNTGDGLAVYIELKAKGRRVGSALAPKQRMFLTRKIQTGCFAICCDGLDYLERTWKHFLSLSKNERIVYLLNELPEHTQRQLDFDDF